jgi:two-component system NtrC family sensor kinase
MAVRLGLRAQIVLALLAVFLLSFALLGTATVRLTRAASQVDKDHAAAAIAQTTAAALQLEGAASAPAGVRDVLETAVGKVPLLAAQLEGPDGAVVVGRVPRAAGIAVMLSDGRRLTVWPEPAEGRARGPLANLLSFYVAITGLTVLMLAYFALTHLIVRPLDRITQVSEQLRGRELELRAPEEGAVEVVRLASALNHMATELRAEREALVQRLRELEQRTEELKATQAQLIHGEKLASVGRLAAGVAHEIGNPLAAILGLVELLRGGGLPEAQSAEFLARIQGETERIHHIIRDLLDFARRDGDAEGQDESTDLAEVVNEAVAMVRPQKLSKQVAIELELPADLPKVRGPRSRLTQVVLNLLLNALDALQGRGSVSLRARRDGERCVLLIEDDGPGIAPEIADRLFEPFATTKPTGQGTGLGLAVSLALVESMGGTIRACSRTPHGARFEVVLRAA